MKDLLVVVGLAAASLISAAALLLTFGVLVELGILSLAVLLWG